jgi:hypothetical protein
MQLTDEQIDSLIKEFCVVEVGDLVHSCLVATDEAMRDFARALLSASKPAAQMDDYLPDALWARNGSGHSEWWSFKGYEARKDAADWWVLRKAGEELYRHTYLQVVMAHAEREILAESPAAPAQSAEPVLPVWFDAFLTNVCELPDRNSPEDEPEAIVATLEELKSCALNAIENTEASTGICFFCGEPINGQHETDCPQSPQPSPTAVAMDEERAAKLIEALEETQGLLVAMLHEMRPREEIEMQIGDNRTALQAWQARAAFPQPVAQPVEQTRALTEVELAKAANKTCYTRTDAQGWIFDTTNQLRAFLLAAQPASGGEQ